LQDTGFEEALQSFFSAINQGTQTKSWPSFEIIQSPSLAHSFRTCSYSVSFKKRRKH